MVTIREKLDPELVAGFEAYPFPPIITIEILPTLRPMIDAFSTGETALGDNPFNLTEEVASAADGTKVPLSVFAPKSASQLGRPCIYYMHSGGLVMSNQYGGVSEALCAAKEIDATVVSVGYRLAPDHPAPAGLDDCYLGLTWIQDNADKLGIDRAKVAVWGSSAGGCLATGITLLARDRKLEPMPAGLVLQQPMLDNKIDEVDARLFSGEASKVWSAESNAIAWKAYLGDNEDNSANPYYVPARATDLAGLPPVSIDVGSVELFRKGAIRLAEKVWEAGGDAELHVWQGAFHSFDVIVPGAGVSRKSLEARKAFVHKVLS